MPDVTVTIGPVEDASSTDAIRFDLDPLARGCIVEHHVIITPGPAADAQALGGLVVGPVLARLCRQLGWQPFDGSAIARDEGGAILILGLPGAGKSTLAAALNRPVWGDGVLAIGLSPSATLHMAGPTPLRLWADGLAALQWPVPNEKPLREPWRRWSVRDRAVITQSPPLSVPIRGIVFPKRANSSSVLTPMSPAVVAARLGGAQWRFDALVDTGAFTTFAELAESVPAVSIELAPGAERLSAAARVIEDWIAGLQP